MPRFRRLSDRREFFDDVLREARRRLCLDCGFILGRQLGEAELIVVRHFRDDQFRRHHDGIVADGVRLANIAAKDFRDTRDRRLRYHVALDVVIRFALFLRRVVLEKIAARVCRRNVHHRAR